MHADKNLRNGEKDINPRSLKGGGANGRPPPLDFFGLKSERLDQLPNALAQLFLDNEYMFWH